MLGYINTPLALLAKFPATHAAPDSVGYTLHNPDGTTHTPRSTAVVPHGLGAFVATLNLSAPFAGVIKWDCTVGATTLNAFEELAVITPASVSVDLAPVLDELTSPLYGLAASMALLVDVDAEVDTVRMQVDDIHTGMGNLGAALSAGLATEVTQAAILDLLTIPGYPGHVIPAPAPAQPGLQSLYGFVLDPAGQPVAGATVTAQLDGVNRIDNEFLVKQQLSSTTGVDGLFVLTLVQAARYAIAIPAHGKQYPITTTAETTATLGSYITGGA